jgi:hypothetical protein
MTIAACAPRSSVNAGRSAFSGKQSIAEGAGNDSFVPGPAIPTSLFDMNGRRVSTSSFTVWNGKNVSVNRNCSARHPIRLRRRSYGSWKQP